jgi:hypothetical protein
VTESVRERSRELADRINQEAKGNPDSPYAGKFVGIADGQMVVVADTLREAVERLRQAEPDPARCCCIEASYDYDQIHDIRAAVR